MVYELEDMFKVCNKKDVFDFLEVYCFVFGVMSFIRQQVLFGLGYVIWCVCDIIGDELFVILLFDVIIKFEVSCLKQMVDLYDQIGGNIIVVEEVLGDQIYKYGIVELLEQIDVRVSKILNMVEKLVQGIVLLNLMIMGCYIL